MNLLTYLSWVKKLWKTVIDIIKLIEETIPDNGAGKEKLAAFDLLLKAAIDKSEDIDEEFDKLQPVAHDIVNVAVALFNKTGLFKKS
jgi:Sec7-like guanine-nucleotide exchange factor